MRDGLQHFGFHPGTTNQRHHEHRRRVQRLLYVGEVSGHRQAGLVPGGLDQPLGRVGTDHRQRGRAEFSLHPRPNPVDETLNRDLVFGHAEKAQEHDPRTRPPSVLGPNGDLDRWKSVYLRVCDECAKFV